MEVNGLIDHTNLKQNATAEDIKKLCAEAKQYKFATVAINSCWVSLAHAELEGSGVGITSCIGFPLGAASTAAKVAEAKQSVADGTTEIDMVINIGWVKDGRYDRVEEEIRTLKECCKDKILKVIIETCLLTDEEKIRMCEVVTRSGADFIKTSTGFSKAGATFDDVALFKAHVGKEVKIKAAGGISSLSDAEKFLELGAERLGTSRMIKLVKQEKSDGGY